VHTCATAAVAEQQARAEKVAENILCEWFTGVVDWATEQVRLQEQRVDLMLVRGGLKYLIVEVKRPGSFEGRGAIMRALTQARGYATELRVDRVAISDGCILEAYDVTGDGLRPHAGAPPPVPNRDGTLDRVSRAPSPVSGGGALVQDLPGPRQ
jgi:hypothetical protein